MGHYITLGARDHQRAVAFYDVVLATIGWASHTAFKGWKGYSEGGSGRDLIVWVCTPYDGVEATPGNGVMVGFNARTRAEVDAFHAAAMANGGSDEGAPGLRPAYGPTWYAAYMRDPSGNKIAAYINR